MPYLNVDEIDSALTTLSETYPELCEVIDLPNRSIEGRACRALRIGLAPEKDGVLFTGATHAREWGGSEICVNLATDLLEASTMGTGLSYGGKRFTADQVRSIIDGMNVFVIPVVNPDGRHHSQTEAPLWRKNRNPAVSNSPRCVGVDLNRNYDFLWDFKNLLAGDIFVATSADPCDPRQTYRGPAPISEPETKNVQWLLDENSRIKGYIDIHCYGELILYCWGDDEIQSDDPSMNFKNPEFNSVRGIQGDDAYREFMPSDDREVIISLANRMHDAIRDVRDSDYTVQQSMDLYPTTGASDDYAYSRHMADPSRGKVYAFTIEWGREFQPTWEEMEGIILDVTSGLIEFCLAISPLETGARRA